MLKRRKTVERIVENERIHLYFHLTYVSSPDMHAKNAYHNLVSLAVRIGGLSRTSHWMHMNNASAMTAEMQNDIAPFLLPTNESIEAVIMQTIDVAGNKRHISIGIVRTVITEKLMKILEMFSIIIFSAVL